VTHIDETPRPDLVMREGIVVSMHGEVIVIPRGYIAEVRRRQCFFGERLELHDVQDLRCGRYRGKRLKKFARRGYALRSDGAIIPPWQAGQAPEYRAPRHAIEFAHGIPRIEIVSAAIIADRLWERRSNNQTTPEAADLEVFQDLCRDDF
jgi:hypothetical protein